MTKVPLELEIHINEEGEVILTELPREMAEMVLELDPDHTVACTLNQANIQPTDCNVEQAQNPSDDL